jgi:hypothetical protein
MPEIILNNRTWGIFKWNLQCIAIILQVQSSAEIGGDVFVPLKDMLAKSYTPRNSIRTSKIIIDLITAITP